MKEFTRRDFLKTTAALGAAAIIPAELGRKKLFLSIVVSCLEMEEKPMTGT
jgi:hypothetical protein